jgi:hypothetical protein
VKVHAARRFDVKLRPYTLRSGDTLQSIAKKRGAARLCDALEHADRLTPT